MELCKLVEWSCEDCITNHTTRSSFLIPEDDDDEEECGAENSTHIHSLDTRKLLQDISRDLKKTFREEIRNLESSLQLIFNQMRDVELTIKKQDTKIQDLEHLEDASSINIRCTNEPARPVKYHDHTEDRREVEAIPTFCSKVPVVPVTTLERKNNSQFKVDSNTIALLERLSLVKCDTVEGVEVLEDSIAFADKILHINTDNIEPLYSVLENENLSLRSDEITQGNCQKDILKNASLTEDDYFVAPPGNIPLHEVTTTPSLFSLSDIKHKENSANVDVLANFNWGSKIVEAVSIDTVSITELDTESSYLRCKMSLEDALFTLLLDGLNNSTKEEYLRLHNKMAPYKIALALEYDDSKYFDTLKELAALMMHKLEQRNISTICPNVELPLKSQLRENFKIGVTYTAIISENTLSNGIFHLLNSSTMLKEQIHLADFESYATLLCGK
ncbi:GatC-like protein [Papilio machaon]|uniref:Glutamyl-tRNA(Gln) amidotransferase subunit C, mitochondrial n=1 Tax=Papilio machaon TaxID=76193 RepID=A0A194QRQ1_PAPMA|nr:GatC-like protein [Papilio machaon]